MKKIIIICFVMTMHLMAQDMRQNAFASLFSDQKASKIGDAITILVMESSQASNNAETNTSRNSDISLKGSLQVGKNGTQGGSADLGTGNTFSGAGNTKTTGLVNTKISATVDSVLPNGNLLIKGSRKITINDQEQTINIKGVVRTSDIQSDNSVLSYNISEAEIKFDGDGSITSNQKPGWLTRFFHWIF